MANAAVLNVLVLANTNPASRSLLRFNTTLRATESSSNKALGAVQTFAKGAALGAGAGLAYAVKKAADFEQQIDSLGAVTNASGRNMDRFRKQAMAAGAATKFSALDAAVAQTELAKGGLSVANIMKGGLRSALALAAAGELELGEAATFTVNAMKLFGIRGRDSMKVADALATAANATTADVRDFGMALQQGGTSAKAAGLSFQETVATLEALASIGIKNTDAGTSLKTTFAQLATPTAKASALMKQLNLQFFDSRGNIKSIVDISAMLRDRFSGLTKEQRLNAASTLAGTDGMRTLLALYDVGPGKLSKFEQGLNKQGTAADVAAKKQDNLKGKLENLQGSVETLAIAFGTKLLPSLTKAAEDITDVLNDKTLTSGEKFQKLGQMLGKALAAAGPVVAKAAAGLAVIGVQAFFDAFRNSPLWIKLLTAGFILSKLGGFSAFRTIGTRAGASMGAGIGEGMAKGGAAGGIAGKFKGAAGAFRTVGRNVLGAALLAGVADAATRQGISGFGDRFQQAASTATFGLLPAPRDLDQRMAEITKKIRTWHSGVLKLSDSSDPDNSLIRADDLNDFSSRQRKMLTGLAELRNTATKLFGTDFRLNAKMEFNPEAATKRLRMLQNEFGRLRSGAVLDVKQLREVTAANFKRIAETMGVNSAAGQAAVAKNFKLGLQTIRNFKDRGVLNTSQAMKEVSRLLRVHSGAGKESLKENFAEARNFIAKTMRNSQGITQQGMTAIRRIFAQELKLYGLSAESIKFRLSGKEQSGKTIGAPLVGKQRGGPINLGAPSGDSVPAMLERGEYVLNRKAVAKAGKQRLDALNFGAAPRFQSGGGVGAMVAAANKVDKAQFPYVWGGGHQGSPAPFGPFDCSGAVSYVLQHGGVQIPTMVSGALAGAGSPGPGAVTVFANPTHTFMRIGSRYFGTSGSNPGGGAGWFPDPGASYRSGFTERHFKGKGGLGMVPPIVVVGPDSPLRSVAQGAVSGARAGANKTLRNAMFTPIGAGDAGDPGPSGDGKKNRGRTRAHGFQRGGQVGKGSKLLAGLDKVFPAHYLGQPGAQLSSDQVRAVAEAWGGLNPARAVQADQITLGESSRHPGIIGQDPGGTLGIGLWQITRGVQGALGKSWIDSRGGDTGMRNPRKNAEVMSIMSGKGSSWSNWFGTSHLGSLQANVQSVFGKGGGGKGGASIDQPRAKKAHHKLKAIFSHLKGVTLPTTLGPSAKALKKQIGLLTAAADVAGDMASRAESLGESVGGKDQTGWLNEQLGYLFALRNTLIDAETLAEKKRDAYTKAILEAQKRLQAIHDQIDRAAKDRRGTVHQLNVEKGKKKPNKGKIRDLQKRIATIDSNQASRVADRKVLDQAIPAFTKERKSINTSRGDLLSTLTDVQGVGSPLVRLGSLPQVGVLGGQIFEVQLALRTAAEQITDNSTSTTDAAGNDDVLQQLLREANLRTSVSQRQYDVLKNFDATSGAPFLGAFAKGGVALVGERGPELAHLPSGTRVHSASDTEQMLAPNIAVHINGDIVNTPRGKDPVEVLLNDRRFKAAIGNSRLSRRGSPLPGAGGGGF